MSVASDIILGSHDAELESIISAAKDRQDTIKMAGLVDIKRGDTVEFSDAIRPRYMIGLTAKVAKINPKSITVDCPDDLAYGKFAGAKGVRCPKTLIKGKVAA